MDWPSTREKVPSDITDLIAKSATKKGFEVSQKLSDPISYNVFNKNPILECLVDQMNQDKQRSGGNISGLLLRDEIIKSLNQNIIDWPHQNNKIITKGEWIRLMKKDTRFYLHQSR